MVTADELLEMLRENAAELEAAEAVRGRLMTRRWELIRLGLRSGVAQRDLARAAGVSSSAVSQGLRSAEVA